MRCERGEGGGGAAQPIERGEREGETTRNEKHTHTHTHKAAYLIAETSCSLQQRLPGVFVDDESASLGGHRSGCRRRRGDNSGHRGDSGGHSG